MFDDFKPTPKTIENLSELANKVYDDGLKKPVQQTGEVLSLIPRAIKAALEPFERLILYREYSIAVTEKMLEEKLADTDPEEIVSPEPYVAVPAINAVAYCSDSDELRNLYANLIARSMLKTEKDKVHPAFVEIIKQLSPTDAIVLKFLYEKSGLFSPVVHLQWYNPKNRTHINIMKNICNIDAYDYQTTSMSIENLQRLSLIEISTDEKFSKEEDYEKILKSSKFDKFMKGIVVLSDPEDIPKFIKASIQPTTFGFTFCETCIKDL